AWSCVRPVARRRAPTFVSPSVATPARSGLIRGALDAGHFEHGADAGAVPAIQVMAGLHAGIDDVGIERGHAGAAGMAHAVVDDAVGAGLAQASGQRLADGVAVRIVHRRPAAAHVVQAAVYAGAVTAHLQID